MMKKDYFNISAFDTAKIVLRNGTLSVAMSAGKIVFLLLMLLPNGNGKG